MYTLKIIFEKYKINIILFAFLTLVLLAFGGCENTCKHHSTDSVIEHYIHSTENEEGSYEEVTYCLDWGTELSRVKKIVPVHSHIAGKAVEENLVPATCIKDGSYDLIVHCTICDIVLSTEKKIITKLGHHLQKHDGKEATCTESGYEEYETCSRCNYTTYTEISAKHTPDTTVKEDWIHANCYNDGYYYDVVYCKDCHIELSREFVVETCLGHDIVEVSAKDSTCEEMGWMDYEYCTREDCNYTTIVDIPPKNHSKVKFEEFFTPSTCTKAGGYAAIFTCEYCGKIMNQEHHTYDLSPHTAGEAVKENETSADCYHEGGYDMVVYCNNPECDYEFSRIHTTIPITHQLSEVITIENEVAPTYGFMESGTEGGYDEVVYCSKCNGEVSRQHTVTKITASEYYSQYDYLELSSTTNSIDNIIDNGNGTYILNAKTHMGKSIRLLIIGPIESFDGGWGKISKDTIIYTLDALPGVNYIDYELKSCEDKDFLAEAYYSLSKKTSVSSPNELFLGFGGVHFAHVGEETQMELSRYPDYLCFNSLGASSEIVSMKFYYCNVMSTVKDIQLVSSLYSYKTSQSYLPGDLYDAKIEIVGLDYAFPLDILIVNEATLDEDNKEYSRIMPITADVIFGDIYDENGNAVDKTNRYLQSGDMIEVTIGDCSVKIRLCNPVFTSDKIYDANTIGFVKSIGTQNVLVVPVTFNDQTSRVNNEWLTALKGILGNVMDDDGNVKEYSLSNGNISLSKYLYTSSYGKFNIRSYITDTYVINKRGVDAFNDVLTANMVNDISNWLKLQNIDRTIFDQNNDGYYDIVLLVNTLQITESSDGGYMQAGLSGGVYFTFFEGYSNAGTSEYPMINACINASSFQLFSESGLIKDASATTLIHEFGHALGLEDYYDNGKNSNTIGHFDMESDNKGDWNSYSKYLLGWIKPITIDESEDEVEITISSYSTHGDAILIHALGYNHNGTPFDEYIIIDLYAHDGLYTKDAIGFTNMSDAVGVRIYHINSIYDMLTISSSDKEFTSAWPHYGVSSDQKYASQGKHLIEMVQKGNINTFMGSNYLDNFVDGDDLFYAGDSFSVDEYNQFFYNGKMDNGMDFGYTITIKGIVESGADSTATIVIFKK